MAHVLRGTDLRYTLTRLLQLFGPCSIPQLLAGLAEWGFVVDGRPSKTVSDALRWEVGRDRVRRRGRAVYGAGAMPRSTEYRIMARVFVLRDAAAKATLSLEGGQEGEPRFPVTDVTHGIAGRARDMIAGDVMPERDNDEFLRGC